MVKDKSPKKQHLIHYANGPSLEEINGSITVPKIKAFGKRYLCIPDPVL